MEYYTIKDIMSILGVCRNTAYKIADMDDVPTLRIGNMIRIDKNGFDEWCRRRIKTN
jgi:hypothetical protein